MILFLVLAGAALVLSMFFSRMDWFILIFMFILAMSLFS